MLELSPYFHAALALQQAALQTRCPRPDCCIAQKVGDKEPVPEVRTELNQGLSASG